MSTQKTSSIYPLSALQQGILFNTIYTQHSGIDIIQVISILNEKLETKNLERAWHQVFQRHPVLRTAFRWDNLAVPQQEVYSQVNLPFQYYDYRHLSQNDAQAHLENFLLEDRRQGFEVSVPPLARLNLFQFTEAQISQILTFHHSILDGRSLLILLQEVSDLYDAYCQNQDLDLPTVRPYGDYIQWLQQRDGTKDEAFWRQYLKGFTTPTLLATHQKTSTAQTHHAVQDLPLSQSTTDALKLFCQTHALTLTAFVQAVWALLLSRYTGQEDVLFGITRSCRYGTVPEADAVIGLLINTLPLRLPVPPHALLLDWLKDVRQTNIVQREYVHTSLSDIQAWSERPGQEILFDHLVIFEKFSLNSALRAQGGKWLQRTFSLNRKPSYPLAMYAFDDEQLLIKLIYDQTCFEDAHITRILGHFHNALQQILENPLQRLADVSFLTVEEKTQILDEWNATASDYPNDQCLHTLFETQAEHNPDAIAVIAENQTLTYGELNQRANQLAHYLQKQGLESEMLIAVCVERSLEMVISLLGILKAGGAYLPIDANYPQARLEFILRDANVKVVLTQSNLGHLFSANENIICLDRDWAEIAVQPTENIPSAVYSNYLAYAMYTSGTTGTPKAVCVTHHNVVRLVMETNFAHFSAQEIFLQFAPISFDASTLEVWGALLHGAKLVIAPKHTLSLAELGETIRKHQVSFLWLTSALFAQMVDYQLDDLKNVRQLLAGGDVLSPTHVQKLALAAPNCQIINGYGPTENTTFTACFRVTEDSLTKTSLPIGRAISNTQIYLLNEYLKPVPIGVPGELYTAGDGLARGYLNRPDLTAERFIPNPFSAKAGARMYRTGDLARWLPNGNIEYLGRIDYQVKIRGFRIELGEIESVLNSYPAIQAAVVLTREDVNNGHQLVAYLVTDKHPTQSQMRDYLSEKLPVYMIPSEFIAVSALPLTPNGKVDRQALLTMKAQHLDTNEFEFIAPRTSTEIASASLWGEVLSVQQVSIRDNFFALGGHSLAAMRLVVRIEQTFNLQLPMRDLFEHPTLEGFAQLIAEKLQTSSQTIAEIPPIPKYSEKTLINLENLSDDEVDDLLNQLLDE